MRNFYSNASFLFVRSHLTLFALPFFGIIALAFGPNLFKSKAAFKSQPLSSAKRSATVPGEILVRFKPDSAVTQTKTRSQLTLAAKNQVVSVSIEPLAVTSEVVPGLRLARVASSE